MAASLPPPTPTCREFHGTTRGWCPRPQRKDGFCWPHAEERQQYNAATLLRTTGRSAA